MQPLAQLVGFIAALGAAVAGDHHPGRSHPGETGQPKEFPAYPHGPRRLLGAMNATVLTLEEAVATASTGDIWLFRGTSLSDRTIRAATNSPVNHVGMVVAIDDLSSLLWHAELGASLPDVWTGERHRGVQLHLLEEAVTTWSTRYHQSAWVRQLQGTIDRDQEDRLMEVIDRFDGRPFPAALRLLRQRFTGRLHRSPSLETVFCAELVAATYQAIGLLPRTRPPSWYDPGRFWSGDRIALTPPYILGDEIAVR
jgi:hypothetical protein